jgi:predicted MFS family arabinose efflux permease
MNTQSPQPEVALSAAVAQPATVAQRAPVLLFTITVAVLITNLFGPQTLVGLMAAHFGLSTAASGTMAMVSTIGYSVGLFFIVPLADLIENRRLIITMLACASLCAIGVILAPNAYVLFPLLFVLGACCTVIQILMPTAAAMTEPAQRGRVLGDIMGGLMVGILLSRPAASFLAGVWDWKGFFVASAICSALLFATLAIRLPERRPPTSLTYGALIGSLWELLRNEPVLLKRAIMAAIVMAAFNIFWTSIVFVLNAAPFHFEQHGIALFTLVGAGGAVVTPLVGRMADKGYGQRATNIAHIVLILGFGVAAIGGLVYSLPIYLLLGCLGLSAITLDVGVLGNHTVGRQMINMLSPEARGRINALFVGIFFLGGAIGSTAASMLWVTGGWATVCLGGAMCGLLSFIADCIFRPGSPISK